MKTSKIGLPVSFECYLPIKDADKYRGNQTIF